MAVLELLAGATGTGIVTSRQFVLHNRGAGLLGTGVLGGSGSLIGINHLLLLQILLALRVLLSLCVLLGGSLLYLLLHLRNSGTCQDAGDAVVHVVNHVVPYLGTLQLEDEERVFLLVAGVLNRVLQFIELAEVLLPGIVDDMQQNLLLKLLDRR